MWKIPVARFSRGEQGLGMGRGEKRASAILARFGGMRVYTVRARGFPSLSGLAGKTGTGLALRARGRARWELGKKALDAGARIAENRGSGDFPAHGGLRC
jgi:hypothetical protein